MAAAETEMAGMSVMKESKAKDFIFGGGGEREGDYYENGGEEKEKRGFKQRVSARFYNGRRLRGGFCQSCFRLG